MGVNMALTMALPTERGPSPTSLDPPGAALGDLVGHDEPQDDLLEEPQEYLAVDRRAGRAFPSGGQSPPSWRASSAAAPENGRPP
jgi:hypothetical protein